MKKFFKILLYSILAISLLILLLVGFMETSWFKNRLRVTVIALLKPAIHGSLQIGAIRGNLFTGLTLDSVVIYSGSDPFLSVGHIRLRHDPFALLNKSVNISQLQLDRVNVTLIRGTDSIWNIDRIFPASPTPSGEPSPWGVNLGSLDLRNSSFSLVDSTNQSFRSSAIRRFNFARFSLNNINVRSRVFYHSEDLYLDISAAHIDAALPEEKRVTMSGVISASSAGIAISKFVLSTGTSDLSLNARLANTNIFKPISPELLSRDSVSIILNADRVDLDEVSTLFSDAGMMKGIAAIDLEAGGLFGNLNIRRLSLKTHRSLMHMVGNIQHLEHPKDIVINAILGDSKIEPADIAEILPNQGIPPFTEAGIQATSIQFNGSPVAFSTTVELSGKSGTVTTSGTMNFSGDIPAYDLKFTARNLQPDKFIGSIPVSFLDAKGTVKGGGFGVDDVTTHCDITIDSAKVRNIQLGSSRIVADATPKVFNGTASLNGPEMAVKVDGLFDLTSPDNPIVRATISSTALNLGRVLSDTSLRSSLTLRTTLSTRGKTVDNLNGDISIAMEPSTFRGIPIDSGTIMLHLDQADPLHKSLELQSSYLDAQLHGRFDLDIVGAYLTEQIPHLLQSIFEHTYRSESEMDRNIAAENTVNRHTVAEEQLDFSYLFRFYNSKAATTLAGITPIDAVGTMQGSIRGNSQTLAVVDSAHFSHLYVLSPTKPVIMDSIGLKFDIRNVMLHHTLDTLNGTLNVSVGSGLYEAVPVRNLRADASFANARGRFALNVSWDTLYTVTGGGSAAVEDQAYAIDFDTLSVTNRHLAIHNVDDVQARIDSVGITIMHGMFQHHDDFLSLEGGLAHGQFFDVRAQLKHFPLHEINDFLPPIPVPRDRVGLFGDAAADITLKGTTHEPVFTVNLTVDSAAYRQADLGNLSIKVDYSDRLAHLNVAARTSPGDQNPKLTVTGTLPINASFVKVDERFPDTTQDIHIHSDNYPLDFLQPILPTLENLRGTFTGDLTVSGTPTKPEYSGPLTIHDARFTFVPNNIAYLLNGDLVPSGDSVRLQNVTLKNVPGEKAEGSSRVEGTVSFANYNLSGFNLKLYGDLLVMSDASAKPMPTLYGTLYTEMGPDGVSFWGTVDHPHLGGTLLIREANLLFPETRVVSGTSGTQLPYIIVDDTTKTSRLSREKAAEQNAPEREMRMGPTEPEGTFITNLRYELTVKTLGKTRIRMVFTTATSEELFADLDGKLELINETGTATAFGQIAIGSESYYNFIKKFTATGNMSFDGQWDNPNMNITAKYEAFKTKIDTVKSAAGNQSTSEKVIVNLDISGTRYEPKLVMSLQEQTDPTDQNSIRDRTSGDVQADALSFLITGKFRDELTTADNATISSVGGGASSSLAYGFASSVMSDVLTRYLQEQFPFVQSATINYYGSQSDLQLSTEVGNGTLRTGTPLNDLGNANASYQVSLGKLFNLSTIRNLYVEVAHTVDGNVYDESHRSTTTNAARIYYKISF